MKRKHILLLTFILLGVTWLLVPWEQLQTNGSGDGLSLHKFRGYHLVLESPKVDETLRVSPKGNIFVQPDWVLLSIEDFGVLSLGWGISAVSEALRKKSRKLTGNE